MLQILWYELVKIREIMVVVVSLLAVFLAAVLVELELDEPLELPAKLIHELRPWGDLVAVEELRDLLAL